MRIELMTDSEVVYTKQLQGDVFLYFIDFLWSKDSTRVAFFINGLPRKGFAYDFTIRKEISFESMKNALGEKIRREYHLSITQDPFDCLLCARVYKGAPLRGDPLNSWSKLCNEPPIDATFNRSRCLRARTVELWVASEIPIGIT